MNSVISKSTALRQQSMLNNVIHRPKLQVQPTMVTHSSRAEAGEVLLQQRTKQSKQQKLSHRESSSSSIEELSLTTRVAAKFCDYIERGIVWYFHGDESSASDRKSRLHWYEGNYGPTSEMAPAAHLPVTGSIPVRTYIRPAFVYQFLP